MIQCELYILDTVVFVEQSCIVSEENQICINPCVVNNYTPLQNKIKCKGLKHDPWAVPYSMLYFFEYIILLEDTGILPQVIFG